MCLNWVMPFDVNTCISKAYLMAVSQPDKVYYRVLPEILFDNQGKDRKVRRNCVLHKDASINISINVNKPMNVTISVNVNIYEREHIKKRQHNT